jgi:DNA polymerase III subunit gamma/tau
MALDTKYRPRAYDDVLGQEAATAVLRQFIKEKRGFHQSYVFCGQHGSGKTTMGRILARALLCYNPQEGIPCDECHSCRVFLDGGTHECFEELDAATKSGKSDLAKIVEDVTYSTFSGKRRIYLFDESHRLSKQALDALLKPMEDTVEGTQDKKLVCIFCTTEPEKMVSTIFSRCAPAFVIRAVQPEVIANRLSWVCSQEGIEFDLEALVTIAEATECHIRDALKTLEGVSMLGRVTRQTVFQYLQLGANDRALQMVDLLGRDLKGAMELASQMAMEVSPSSAYERIAEAALVAYRAHLGVGKPTSKWNPEKVLALAERGSELLGISSRFASPPYRPTRQALSLDVGAAHYALIGKSPPDKASKFVLEVSGVTKEEKTLPPPLPAPEKVYPAGNLVIPSPPSEGTPKKEKNQGSTVGGVWVDTRAIGAGPKATQKTAETFSDDALGPEIFRQLVRHHLRNLIRGGSQ